MAETVVVECERATVREAARQCALRVASRQGYRAGPSFPTRRPTSDLTSISPPGLEMVKSIAVLSLGADLHRAAHSLLNHTQSETASYSYDIRLVTGPRAAP